MIASAVDQYAVEYSKMSGNAGRYSRLDGYMKKGTPLYSTASDVFGQPYGLQTVDKSRNPSATWNALSDVADTAFFSLGHY